MAYIANGQVFLRRLQDLESSPVAGTQGVDPCNVVFSPDSRWLAFYSAVSGNLVRVPVTGGALVTLARLGTTFPIWGLRWEPDDSLLYARPEGIERVVASGGTPERLVDVGPDKQPFDAPQLLPGGRALLFAVRQTDTYYWNDASIVATARHEGAPGDLVGRRPPALSVDRSLGVHESRRPHGRGVRPGTPDDWGNAGAGPGQP